MITEGRAVIDIPKVNKISKEMGVFYNPVMKHNRDISIILLNSLKDSKLNIADPLAGTGIRSIRFLKELDKNKIKRISVNDYSEKSVKSIRKNLLLNKIKNNKKIMVYNEDANNFILGSSGFDYIDVDPFGTPNPYLDSAVKRIARNGILAVTATDTSALCGTYENACKRKYWAKPLRNELKHEIGLRILIRKVQLVGAQYNKALNPLFSYSKDHYMRVFFRCEKSKESTDDILKQHDYLDSWGPMWTGRLWDKKLADRMYKSIKNGSSSKKSIYDESLIKFLKIIKDEAGIYCVGFFDIHELVSRNKIKQIPKKKDLIEKIKKLGYNASETHFNPEAVRSDISVDRLISIL